MRWRGEAAPRRPGVRDNGERGRATKGARPLVRFFNGRFQKDRCPEGGKRIGEAHGVSLGTGEEHRSVIFVN